MNSTNNLYLLNNTDNKGLGVFANRIIPKGSIVFQDIAMVISNNDYKQLKLTSMWNKIFVRLENSSLIDYYICFGISTFLNHSIDNNLVHYFHDDINCTWIRVESIRDIEHGEELLIKYNRPDIFGL